MDYEKDLKIDRYNLELEWERQPQLYVKWAENHADAILERDRKKESLDLLKAELYMEIVKKHLEKGDKKPTESMIANLILQHKDFKVASERYLEFKRDAEYLAGAKEGMQHKKTALEHLSRLFINSYYAEPNIPSDAKVDSFERTDTEGKKLLKESRDRTPLRRRVSK